MQAVEKCCQAASAGAVDDEPGGGVRSLAKKKIADTVAIGIKGVNQIEARLHIQTVIVGRCGQQLLQFAVNIHASENHDVGFSDGCGQHKHRFIAAGEIEGVDLHILK